jgi:hypothetical protein
MPRKPPFYTFQRSKKVYKPPLPLPEERELYTPVETGEDEAREELKYSRYTFYVLCLIVLILILLSGYLIRFGVPVRIRG